jgi:PAS domain S-box-containing protein/excisionase family DNA binding protein
MKTLMTTKEAAKYLKLHYVTLYKLAQHGRIPALRIGGRWRFDRGMLDDWVSRQTIASAGHVLIAEDDPDLQEILLRAVSSKGFRTVAAESSSQAIEELQKQRFELIFLDLALPDEGAKDILAVIDEQKGKCTIITLTDDYKGTPASNSTQRKTTRRSILKPFNMNDIAEVLDSIDLSLIEDIQEHVTAGDFLKPAEARRVKKPGKAGSARKGTTPSEAVRTDRSDTRFKELLDHLPESVFEADKQGKVLYANKAAFETFGYTEKDLERGINVLQLVTLEDRDRAIENMQKVLAGEEVGVNEYIVQRKDGSKLPIIIHASNVSDSKGNVTGFRGMVVNISKPDQLEEMLWESEEELRIMFESINDAIVVTDLEGRITEANEATVRMSGFSNKEGLIGRSAFELISPENRSTMMETLQARLQDGATREHVEYKGLTADGREIDVAASVSLLRDSSGNPIGLVGVARDVTEDKRAEEVLRQSEKNYRTMFEGMIDGVVVIDAETMKVVLANRRAFDMHGFDPSEDISKVNLLDHVHPDDREQAIKSLAEDMFEKDLRQVVEFRTFTKSGELKWVSGIGTKIEYQGRTMGLVSFRDITTQKQSEEALRESEERYRILIEGTGELIQSMAPDGSILFVNQAWHDILGYSKQDLEHISLFDIIHPDSLDHCTALFHKVIQGESISNIEAKFKAKDGSTIYVVGNASPRYLGGQVIGTQGFFRNVTRSRIG